MGQENAGKADEEKEDTEGLLVKKLNGYANGKIKDLFNDHLITVDYDGEQDAKTPKGEAWSASYMTRLGADLNNANRFNKVFLFTAWRFLPNDRANFPALMARAFARPTCSAPVTTPKPLMDRVKDAVAKKYLDARVKDAVAKKYL